MDYIILDFASDVKIITRQTWESMGKPRLVWSPIQLRLENQSKALPKLEEISTQNGPPKGNNKIIFINFGGKKIAFCVHIFDISPCVLIQISIGIAHWMWNLIPHPTDTHTTYFLWTSLPQKQEIAEKM